jgi:CRP/FNR family cyclic AMP-dependent transcriptional regulator
MELVDCIKVFMHNVTGTTRAANDALLLPEWTEDDWQKLFSRTVPRSIRGGEMVIQRGGTDRALYFVATGWLEIGITEVDGVSISPLARVGAGSVIGEQSFFDGQPRSANVWAVSPGELLRLGFKEFEKFSREEPALSRDLLFALGRVLSTRLRNTTFRVRR